MQNKINKRARKRLERRKADLTRSLELSMTCLALTEGGCDDEFYAEIQAERAELEAICTQLGEPVHIGLSHKIITITDEQIDTITPETIR